MIYPLFFSITKGSNFARVGKQITLVLRDSSILKKVCLHASESMLFWIILFHNKIINERTQSWDNLCFMLVQTNTRNCLASGSVLHSFSEENVANFLPQIHWFHGVNTIVCTLAISRPHEFWGRIY